MTSSRLLSLVALVALIAAPTPGRSQPAPFIVGQAFFSDPLLLPSLLSSSGHTIRCQVLNAGANAFAVSIHFCDDAGACQASEDCAGVVLATGEACGSESFEFGYLPPSFYCRADATGALGQIRLLGTAQIQAQGYGDAASIR